MLAWLRRRAAREPDWSITIPPFAVDVARDFRRETLEPTASASMRRANLTLERSVTMPATTATIAPVRLGSAADIHAGDFIRVGTRLVIATDEAELFRAGGVDAYRVPAKLRNGRPSEPVCGPRSDRFRVTHLKGRTIHTLV